MQGVPAWPAVGSQEEQDAEAAFRSMLPPGATEIGDGIGIFVAPDQPPPPACSEAGKVPVCSEAACTDPACPHDVPPSPSAPSVEKGRIPLMIVSGAIGSGRTELVKALVSQETNSSDGELVIISHRYGQEYGVTPPLSVADGVSVKHHSLFDFNMVSSSFFRAHLRAPSHPHPHPIPIPIPFHPHPSVPAKPELPLPDVRAGH